MRFPLIALTMSIPRFHVATVILACALTGAVERQSPPNAVVNGLQMSVSHDDAVARPGGVRSCRA